MVSAFYTGRSTRSLDLTRWSRRRPHAKGIWYIRRGHTHIFPHHSISTSVAMSFLSVLYNFLLSQAVVFMIRLRVVTWNVISSLPSSPPILSLPPAPQRRPSLTSESRVPPSPFYYRPAPSGGPILGHLDPFEVVLSAGMVLSLVVLIMMVYSILTEPVPPKRHVQFIRRADMYITPPLHHWKDEGCRDMSLGQYEIAPMKVSYLIYSPSTNLTLILSHVLSP